MRKEASIKMKVVELLTKLPRTRRSASLRVQSQPVSSISGGRRSVGTVSEAGFARGSVVLAGISVWIVAVALSGAVTEKSTVPATVSDGLRGAGKTPVSSQAVEAPDWTRDLVIYEINPYAFTSPNGAGDGSGSGTFNSLKEKLPYLAKLGITGIWLAGHNAATDHFYGIKTVYAAVRPDVLDATLGTREEFQAMIAEAHRLGIKVFLDQIMHGVLNESTLVAEHPGWFKGSSWGMTDYDFAKPEMRNWWVALWTERVLTDGADGYRVDLGVRHFDLWDRICRNTQAAGHPIAVFGEHKAYHFGQRNRFNPGIMTDIAGDHKASPRYYSIQISSHDNGWTSPTGNYYGLQGSRCYFGYSAVFSPMIPVFMSGEEFHADQVSLPKLKRGLYGTGGAGGWMYGSWIQWDQLKEPKHADMLADATRILNLRKQNRDLIHSDRANTKILRVPFSSSFGNPNESFAKRTLSGWDSVFGDDQRVSTRLDVDANGHVWIVSRNHEIYEYTGAWSDKRGMGRDISCGADGSVWKIGTDDSIAKWNGAGWDAISGSAKEIAAGANGNVWMINTHNQVQEYTGSWSTKSGSAKSISCGADGSVWIVNGDNDLAKWNGSGWNPPIGAIWNIIRSAVDENGNVWIVNASRRVYKHAGSWSKQLGKAGDIGAGGGKGVCRSPASTSADLCKPYARYLPGKKAIVVLGNNKDRDIDFTLHIPLADMGMDGKARYKVTDLWNDTTAMVTESDLANYRTKVLRDSIPRGGFGAIRIDVPTQVSGFGSATGSGPDGARL